MEYSHYKPLVFRKYEYCTKNKKLQKTADLITFTKEILNEKLHFLCSGTCNHTFLISKMHHFLSRKFLNSIYFCRYKWQILSSLIIIFCIYSFAFPNLWKQSIQINQRKSKTQEKAITTLCITTFAMIEMTYTLVTTAS